MYRVQYKYTNDYRCGCCSSSWEEEEEYESREEALACVPREATPRTGPFFYRELQEVEVKDPDGSVIAWGMLSYPQGFGKANLYAGDRWQGFDGENDFDVFRTDRKDVSTWDQLLLILETDHLEMNLNAARKKSKEAGSDVSFYETRLEELRKRVGGK